MGGNKSESVDVIVDELALSLVGWQVEEAQARLITKPHYLPGFEQHVALSATFRFIPEDWTDRFQASDDDSYATWVLMSLNRRDAPAPTSNYTWVVLEKIKKAKKGLVRVSSKSDTWTCRAPLSAANIELGLTAYDLEDVSGRSRLNLPTATTTPLEINLVDETSVESPRPRIEVAHAYISKAEYETTLTVHAEGIFEFGTADELFKVYLDRNDWEDPTTTLKDSIPFEVAVPHVKFEILDDTGFLLDDRGGGLYGHIPVNDQGGVPVRRPRWIARNVVDIDDLAGDPKRVVVRFTDSDE